jgi:hypothetical protein
VRPSLQATSSAWDYRALRPLEERDETGGATPGFSA